MDFCKAMLSIYAESLMVGKCSNLKLFKQQFHGYSEFDSYLLKTGSENIRRATDQECEGSPTLFIPRVW